MTKIKIDDLPVFDNLDPNELKNVLGGDGTGTTPTTTPGTTSYPGENLTQPTTTGSGTTTGTGTGTGTGSTGYPGVPLT